ncbi:MAG: DUF2259 domain-containing protein [Arenimonas sp.]|nr:DUF2259 domain-containing protein [Arenimonas sp.]
MTQLRTWLGVTAAILIAATPAMAGDIAALQSIGFSDDGSVYAFEEYGVQDGSGFPYSNIYVIDTVKDAYLPGTPIKVRIDDESVGLSKARADALQKAAPLLSTHELADHPGQLVAFNPVSELGADADTLRYLAYPADPAFGGAYALRLERFSTPPTDTCAGVIDDLKAFRLTLTQKDGTAVDELVHEDIKVPASRGCAVDYRLGAAVTYAPINAAAIHMVLVQVLSFGFEGHDGRWIAIPVRP